MVGIQTRDLIVIIPGITGSVLGQKNATGKLMDLWALSGQALWRAAKSLGGNLEQLVVLHHDPVRQAPETDIFATRVIQDFHGVLGLWKIDGYTELGRTVQANFAVTDGQGLEWFPYDWRLSNRHSARRLAEFIQPRLDAWRKTHGSDARVVFVAHSMGGLVARYYLEVLDGGHWSDCRALLTFGTPYRGSVSAANYLANGYQKLGMQLSTLAKVMRSCPSVYELLPTYPAIQVKGEWRRVAECGALPNMDQDYINAAAAFHDEIRKAVDDHRKDIAYLNDGYKIRPFVGVGQTTLQSALLAGNVLTAATNLPEWVQDKAAHGGGDGTVPRASAVPLELSNASNESFVGERHGSLQRNEYVLDDLCERLKTLQAGGLAEFCGPVVAARRRRTIDLQVDELFLSGEPVVVCARMSDGEGLAAGLVANVTPESGEPKVYEFGEGSDGWELTIDGLSPGLHRLRVWGATGGDAAPTAVRESFEVADV